MKQVTQSQGGHSNILLPSCSSVFTPGCLRANQIHPHLGEIFQGSPPLCWHETQGVIKDCVYATLLSLSPLIMSGEDQQEGLACKGACCQASCSEFHPQVCKAEKGEKERADSCKLFSYLSVSTVACVSPQHTC